MPKYQISDGTRSFIIEGPAPPSQAVIAQLVAKLPPQQAAPASEPEPVDESSWTDTAVNLLPAAGGALGGIVGGVGGTAFGVGVGGVPGAMGGAALGGAAGEAAKQLINRVRGEDAPDTSGEAAQAIGGQAVTQGVVEGLGHGASRVVAGVGKAMVENAVRPTITHLRSFPEVMNTIIKHRLPVGAGLFNRMKGSAIATQKLGEAAGVTRELLAKAGESGTRFSPMEIARPVVDLVDDITKQPLGESEQKAVKAMLTEFFERHPGPLTPDAVKDLKQAAQAIAQPIYRAVEKGMPVTADQQIRARFAGALGKGAKENLETIPGVQASEKGVKELIGAKRALTQAEGRRLSLMAEGVTGAAGIVSALLAQNGGADESLKRGAIAYLATRGFMSPRVQSRAGLALTAEATKGLLHQFPRLAEAVLIEAQREGAR